MGERVHENDKEAQNISWAHIKLKLYRIQTQIIYKKNILLINMDDIKINPRKVKISLRNIKRVLHPVKRFLLTKIKKIPGVSICTQIMTFL